MICDKNEPRNPTKKNMSTSKNQNQNSGTSRRRFIKGAAGLSALTVLPRHVLGGPGRIAPSEKTTIACIGIGGQGQINLANFLDFEEVQVVAVCDVNREGAGYVSANWGDIKETRNGGREYGRRMVDDYYAKKKGVSNYQGCRTYGDYRELLEKEDVDAVMVATPDHSHAMIVLAALERGKHVYCEKPLAYTVEEVRRITEAARKAGVATQLGNHGQAKEEARITQEYLLAGAIGPVREVHVSLNKRFWDPPAARPTDTPPVPDGLDWNFWLGPAPERPYHPDYHPWRWRDWRDFGTSPLGDMGCHTLSTIFKALKLESPVTVEAESVAVDSEIYPRRFRVKWEFPARGDMPPVAVTWHDEGYDPPPLQDLAPGRSLPGPAFIGDDGVLKGYRLLPESRMKSYGKPPEVLPRSPGHYKEWVDACRGGPPAGADFVRHGGLLTETPLLGNIAIQLGRKLQWDGPALKITNDGEADRLLRRKYREGWGLPG